METQGVPEVQGFKQNPSRESMVAYVASQMLAHSEILAEDEQGSNIWDVLTQQTPSREAQSSLPIWDVPQDEGDDLDQPDDEYPDEDDNIEEDLAPTTRRRPRPKLRAVPQDGHVSKEIERSERKPRGSWGGGRDCILF